MNRKVIMKVTGILIPHDPNNELHLNVDTGLTDLQAAVGGYVEAISIEQPRLTLFANEEGKIRELPRNLRATIIWWLLAPRTRGVDILCGDVVLTGRDMHGDISPVPMSLRVLLFPDTPLGIKFELHGRPGVWNRTGDTYRDFFEAARDALLMTQIQHDVSAARVVRG
jgi:Domain of unknown function (DUF3846)